MAMIRGNSTKNRAMVLLALAALAFGGIVGAVRPIGAQPGTASPAAGQSDAAALLAKAGTAMSQIKSFHFELTTPRGKTTFMDQFELKSVSGDVQRPDRFQATISVTVAVVNLDIQVIGIGSRIWVTNPLATAGQPQYTTVDAGGGLDALLNPDRLLLQAIRYVQDATITGTQTIDGVTTTIVEGTVDLGQVANPQGTPVPVERFGLPQTRVPVIVWIDGDGRVRVLQVNGPLAPGEDANVVRELDLSKFDQPLDIQPPVGATPAA